MHIKHEFPQKRVLNITSVEALLTAV